MCLSNLELFYDVVLTVGVIFWHTLEDHLVYMLPNKFPDERLSSNVMIAGMFNCTEL